ncbi:MAG: hypothetical protein U0L72_08175 [Acutalibacteraceae bacterium]|nr:hypothetical protein [Acutalibacteraceae bacterium]
MAYGKEDALKTMEGIFGDKQGWTIAGNVKHKINGMNAQDYYEQDAQKKYDELIANGYGTAANHLKNSNLEQAKKYINNFYVKTGRNQFRPYMYEKGKQYGLTKSDIDKLTSFDSETGEVIFGGKNIGRPDGIADDRSYFTSEYLDDVWNNYVNENGITVPKEKLADQTLQNAIKYIDELSGQQVGNRDYIMNTGKEQRQRKDDFIKSQQNADIMNTDTAKAIMDKFNYMGGIAGGDKLTEGAAANGGNIDSFSAANRARQQLAYTTAGTEAVIAEYQNRMNNVMDILKSIDSQNVNEYGALAINHQSGLDTAKMFSDAAQKLYDAENANFNKELADRESKGYFYDYSSNPYLNSDGTVKDIDLDYTSIYNNAMKHGDKKTAKWASEAAYQKYQSNPEEYGKYYNSKIHKLDPADYRQDTATVGANKRQTENEKFVAQLSSDTQIKLQEMLNEVTRQGYDKDKFIAKLTADVENNKLEVDKYIADMADALEDRKLDLGAYIDGNALSYDEAVESIENGELSPKALQVYNAYHGTSYTTENPPPIAKPVKGPRDGTTTETETTPMSKSEVATFVNDLKRKGHLLFMNGIGHYTPLKGGEKALVDAVMESDLSAEQSNYFLKDIVGMSPSEIEEYMK